MGRTRSVGLAGAAILALWGFAAGQESAATAKEHAEVEAREDFLRSAPIITVSKMATTGRTNAWKVYLQDKSAASQAIFKYVDRRRPKPLASSYRYELAAYGLARMLGLYLIPPTVEREVEGRKGSLQCYCEDVIPEGSRRRQGLAPANPAILQNAFSEVGIFENLTANPRLDEADILVRTSDWKVWRIDFSEAFAPMTELIPDSLFSRCSRDLYLKLSRTPDEEFRAFLAPYLTEKEREAVLLRKQLIMERLDGLIKEKGEKAVLFDE